MTSFWVDLVLTTFVFRSGDGRDVIGDFATGNGNRRFFIAGDEIAIDVDGIDTFEDLMGFATQEGGHISFDFGMVMNSFWPIRGSRLLIATRSRSSNFQCMRCKGGS